MTYVDPEPDMRLINILKKTNYNKYKMLGHPGKVYYLSHPKSEEEKYLVNKTPKNFFSKILLLRHDMFYHHYMEAYMGALENVNLNKQGLEKLVLNEDLTNIGTVNGPSEVEYV